MSTINEALERERFEVAMSERTDGALDFTQDPNQPGRYDESATDWALEGWLAKADAQPTAAASSAELSNQALRTLGKEFEAEQRLYEMVNGEPDGRLEQRLRLIDAALSTASTAPRDHLCSEPRDCPICRPFRLATHPTSPVNQASAAQGAVVAWCALNPNGQIAYFDSKPMVMPGPIGNEHHQTPLVVASPASASTAIKSKE